MNARSLTPLLRNSVGFDRFSELFESALGSDESAHSYPRYDIEKHGEDDYLITMAVAGFQRENLSIELQNDQLTIHGRLEDKARDGVEYLHRGIAAQTFERSFRLAEHMQVTGANIRDGLLRIHLTREVPEEDRPRRIPINSVAGNANREAKALESEARANTG